MSQRKKEVKAPVEHAFLQVLKNRLSKFDVFQGDEDDPFNWIESQGVDEFYHPSLVACVERAPLLEEDLLLYEIPLELFVTTLAVGSDYTTIHDERLRKLQEAIGEDGSSITEAVCAFDPRINIHRFEAGESENFTDKIHWVDKQPFTVYLQFS